MKVNEFAPIINEGLYAIDFKLERFHYVPAYGFFLYGHSRDEVMNLGYEFYRTIVHPDDLPLLKKMYTIILNCIAKGLPDDMNYFSLTFRVKDYPQVNKKDYMMILLKLKPVFHGGEIRFGYCTVTISIMPEPGNLRMYYKSSANYTSYSLENWCGKICRVEPLSEEDRKILRYAKQGLKHEDIAEALCMAGSTLGRKISAIFQKLCVHNMEQAIVYATNHLLILHETPCTPESNNKKYHRKLTPEVVQHIQACLNNNQSVNSIAKEIGVSEKAIRKAINNGILTKNSSD
jgi:DNA-binding NarL/FixJ family response regulator